MEICGRLLIRERLATYYEGAIMKKLDLKKDLKYLYQPSAKKVDLVKVPKFKFVMVDGKIEKGKSPGTSPAFAEAMQALSESRTR